MAKKAKNSKRHQLKYAQPTGAPEASSERAIIAEAIASGRDFSYVSKDIKRLSLLAGGLLAIEIILWYVMGHTGLGNAVYNLVKI